MLNATSPLADGGQTGANYWLILAPVAIAIALATWLLLTKRSQRMAEHPDEAADPNTRRQLAETGVSGGVVDPGVVGEDRARAQRDAAAAEEAAVRAEQEDMLVVDDEGNTSPATAPSGRTSTGGVAPEGTAPGDPRSGGAHRA
ncbi:hypothetical protein [Actinomadura parmotrematis]|uniref:Uncharacterized protein n=1 Tax=Actinomadura parmotrematis TaxID=2864039 RepID=A0ABS7FY43_9ACTN|nr:hypothetical protein [Actinomadura parmotrematis]MBW8485346.1 hypothetical protein [Actinomadura parmotrematis]